MNLVRDILNGLFMVSENEAMNLLPFVNSFLEGNVDSLKSAAVASIPYHIRTGPDKRDSILVIPVHGVIMKYSYCGDMGMLELEQMINQARLDVSVRAVVLDIDSGGGEASHMSHVASAIRAFREEKTIIAHFSGICASAAYYIGSQCTELYASIEHDWVGSIGTMMVVGRENENSRSQYSYVPVYAELSTDKNQIFTEAANGKPERLKEFMRETNLRFHSDVRLGRPQISEKMFDGRILNAKDAIEMNAIDGIKRLDTIFEELINTNSL